MAFTSMLRRTSTTLLPVACRAIGSPRSLRGAISTVLSVEKRFVAEEILGRSFIPSSRFFSTNKPAADKSLIQTLQSEIECADEPVQMEDMPEGIPFEIEDIPGERIIRLIRKSANETIEVEVDMPTFDEGDGGDDDNDNDDDASNAAAANMSLGVTISKGSGEKLEFQVYLSPDELVIDNLSIKNPQNSEDLLAYDGPEFSDLDDNLQKAFIKYLEIRGIKPSLASFLYEYMTNKDNREYLHWLKNLKSFVEK